MNREKKQIVVVGVLAFLILSVGAFQFTRKDPPPPPASTKEKAKPTDEAAKAEIEDVKYPELTSLQTRDPFEISLFVSGSNPAPTPPVTPPVSPLHKSGRDALRHLPAGDFGQDFGVPIPGGEVKPVEPPKPVFGYTLVGIVEGDHPMAVFEDDKGNQQLVESGQSLGSSSTVTQISRGKVRVKFNAETLVLNVGGNPNAK